MADDEIVVELEKDQDAVAADAGTGGATEATDPVADLQAQFDDLQKEKKREAEARSAAEHQAANERQARVLAEEAAQSARSEVVDSRLDATERSLSAAKAEADAAESEYVAAQERGDWKKAAEAQRRMSRAESNIAAFERDKAQLAVTKSEAQVTQRRVETSADPVEAFIRGRDAGTQKWLREHPDEARVLATNSDQRRVAKLNAADADARAEGFSAGSPEYFAHVERFLGMTKDEPKTETKPRDESGKFVAARRAPSAPVAPVSGGSSSGGVNGGAATVTLTKGQAQTATDGTIVWNYDDPSPNKRFKKGDPIGIQEMARRVKAMKERGEFDKSWTEQ